MEVIGMCDRVLVMYEGTVSGILDRDEMTEETIMRYAMESSQQTLAGNAS